jgi:hypothetical protein
MEDDLPLPLFCETVAAQLRDHDQCIVGVNAVVRRLSSMVDGEVGAKTLGRCVAGTLVHPIPDITLLFCRLASQGYPYPLVVVELLSQVLTLND